MKKNKNSAIIVAAGNSTRMGQGISKQFLKICERPVIYWTLKAFEDCNCIDEIVVCSKKSDFDKMREIIRKYKITKVKCLVQGGSTRQQSVVNGVNATSSDSNYLVIHDGARPLITCDMIEKAIAGAMENGAAAIGVQVKDTLKIVDENSLIIGTQSRENLWAVQTPQVFEKEIYIKALKAAQADDMDCTDDCQLIERINQKITMVIGQSLNIKITTSDDLLLAEAILKNRGMKNEF